MLYDLESAYTIEDKTVPVEGGEISVRIVVPTSEVKEETFPVLVWFHGGGKTDIHVLPLFVAVVS